MLGVVVAVVDVVATCSSNPAGRLPAITEKLVTVVVAVKGISTNVRWVMVPRKLLYVIHVGAAIL